MSEAEETIHWPELDSEAWREIRDFQARLDEAFKLPAHLFSPTPRSTAREIVAMYGDRWRGSRPTPTIPLGVSPEDPGTPEE